MGTTPVATWSMAMAIKRNEAPQVSATAEVMPHSVGPNCCLVSWPKVELLTGAILVARHGPTTPHFSNVGIVIRGFHDG